MTQNVDAASNSSDSLLAFGACGYTRPEWQGDNHQSHDEDARSTLLLSYAELQTVSSTLDKYALPSGHNPESAVGSAKGADAGAYDLMGGNKSGLKREQALSDFSHSKELQTNALNFIAQAIAAKKTASADLAYLSSQ